MLGLANTSGTKIPCELAHGKAWEVLFVLLFLIKLLYSIGVWFGTLVRIKEQTPQMPFEFEDQQRLE